MSNITPYNVTNTPYILINTTEREMHIKEKGQPGVTVACDLVMRSLTGKYGSRCRMEIGGYELEFVTWDRIPQHLELLPVVATFEKITR